MAAARSVKNSHSSRTPGGGSTAWRPYWAKGWSWIWETSGMRSVRSSQCAPGISQWAWRWLSRCTRSMATRRSSDASASSRAAPLGPETTGLPPSMMNARI